MKTRLLVTAAMLLLCTAGAKAQQTPLTAEEAVKGMGRGINIGNSLDAPTETTWSNPLIQERYFSDLKKAGFDAVRIPVTWGGHTSYTPPYTIDSTFLARVDTVVDWALNNNLFVILDAHHESWLKNASVDTSSGVVYEDSLARFDSIWSQIAVHFKNRSDSLIFEILNEPYPMPEDSVNALNVQELKIIRLSNPTRIVSYSGYMWSNAEQLVSAEIPDSGSQYLIGYYHSYDPWPFGLKGGDTTNSAIFSTIKGKFSEVTAWSESNGIPVILDEFGFINTCAYNPRMYAYATVMGLALQNGVAAFAWDDGGSFTIYNRKTYDFNEIKDILIYTYPQSPDDLTISQVGGSIKLQWQNRNPESDSIIVQRGTGENSFSDYAVVGPLDSVFVDSSVVADTSYYYRLKIVKQDSTEMQSYPIMLKVVPFTSVKQSNVAVQFGLSPNYPNPFNPTTTISYSVPKRGMVTLKVYDVLGQEMATLVNGVRNAGTYKISFDGAGFASGVYFDRLEYNGNIVTRKMVLMK